MRSATSAAPGILHRSPSNAFKIPTIESTSTPAKPIPACGRGEQVDRELQLRAALAAGRRQAQNETPTMVVDQPEEGDYVEEEYPLSRGTALSVSFDVDDGGPPPVLTAHVMRVGLA